VFRRSKPTHGAINVDSKLTESEIYPNKSTGLDEENAKKTEKRLRDLLNQEAPRSRGARVSADLGGRIPGYRHRYDRIKGIYRI